MTSEEYQAALRSCYLIVGALRGLPLKVMADGISYAESFGPVLNPTLYREKAASMAEDTATVRILLRAQTEIERHIAASGT